ncbi:hypothetical protein APT59_11090 [Pseudomonas oryzihabitans]|uniref:Enoyl-CoA hydratase n=1 Tax=Pseudomonas oryzihabitans TaxID=47885 RepID=A0A0U4W009_9PSED|nr:hypothetical protein [Pseudomonas oryzihabitans]ALZ84712.1 hypothetical protein APT59_11090 [Pseudomonas oryzihabitans]
MIRLALYRAPGDTYDRLIRAWTRSPYSHCELVMPDGRFVTSSPRDGGVRAKVIAQDPAVWDFLPLPWIQAAHVEQLLEQEAGAGYDWLGILGSQILPAGIQSRSRWFCSEFCAHALDVKQPHRYSPGKLAATSRRVPNLPA